MLNWIKGLFIKFLRIFGMFAKEVFDEATKIVIAQLKDFANEVVKELSVENITNEDKRKEAYLKIQSYALNKGIAVKDSLVNLVIEMAVNRLKNLKEQ